MIEPSTVERSEWPDATTSYVCALEHRMLYTGARVTKLENALLRITAIIETQTDPDIDALHDVAREALRHGHD